MKAIGSLKSLGLSRSKFQVDSDLKVLPAGVGVDCWPEIFRLAPQGRP